MLRQPANSPAGFGSPHQPEGAVGVTTNKPENGHSLPSDTHPAPQPPPVNERKTFCPTENKPGETDSNKVYGTFKNVAPAVPVNSALPKNPAATLQQADGTTVHGKAMSDAVANQDAMRSTVEQNNATGNWTTMSQTTIILGTDGNTSVLPGTITGVSCCKLTFH